MHFRCVSGTGVDRTVQQPQQEHWIIGYDVIPFANIILGISHENNGNIDNII